MSDPKISLAQQADAVVFALRRQETLAKGGSVKGLRGRAVEEFDVVRLRAACRTIDWLMEHEAEIRNYLRLPGAGRATAVMLAMDVDPDTLASFHEHRSGDPNQ